MDTLIALLILVAMAAIVWWAITQMSLPQPLRVVVIVVFAIIALFLLGDMVGLEGFHLRVR